MMHAFAKVFQSRKTGTNRFDSYADVTAYPLLRETHVKRRVRSTGSIRMLPMETPALLENERSQRFHSMAILLVFLAEALSGWQWAQLRVMTSSCCHPALLIFSRCPFVRLTEPSL